MLGRKLHASPLNYNYESPKHHFGTGKEVSFYLEKYFKNRPILQKKKLERADSIIEPRLTSLGTIVESPLTTTKLKLNHDLRVTPETRTALMPPIRSEHASELESLPNR